MTTQDPATIYRAFEKATQDIAVYVILKNGEVTARVIFEFSKSGLRTTCLFHVYGLRMTLGHASGGGYDKASAAAWCALRAAPDVDLSHASYSHEVVETRDAMRAAIKDQGRHWNNDLEAAGFIVRQIV